MKRQSGYTIRVVLFVTVVLTTAGVLGVFTYHMANKDNTDQDPELAEILDNAECANVSDDNLCKFFTSWQANEGYSAKVTRVKNNVKTSFELTNSTQNDFHLQTKSDPAYEIIVINDTVYTRSTGSTWYEETVNHDKIQDYRQDNIFDFAEPEDKAQAQLYVAAGNEPCGDKNCFRYKIDSKNESTTRFIWFDDANYQLQRYTITRSNDNYNYDASFSYSKDQYTINPPESVAKLAQGQHIPPGATQPQESKTDETLPHTGDQINTDEYRQWLKQRQAN